MLCGLLLNKCPLDGLFDLNALKLKRAAGHKSEREYHH